MDIKTVLGTGKNNIKAKFNEERSQGCGHLLLYYPPHMRYDAATVEEGH